VARNALEAQALCAELDHDVALLDVELPGLQGNEWALYLKEMSPETRIIFVSGQNDPVVRQTALDAGAFGFLAKPFEDEVLVQLIHQAVAD